MISIDTYLDVGGVKHAASNVYNDVVDTCMRNDDFRRWTRVEYRPIR